jgi:hypothetical protein
MTIYAGKITMTGSPVGIFDELGVTPGAYEVVLCSFQSSNGAQIFHCDESGDDLGVPIASAGVGGATYPDAVSRYTVDGDEMYLTGPSGYQVGVSLFSRPAAGPMSATFNY